MSKVNLMNTTNMFEHTRAHKISTFELSLIECSTFSHPWFPWLPSFTWARLSDEDDKSRRPAPLYQMCCNAKKLCQMCRNAKTSKIVPNGSSLSPSSETTTGEMTIVLICWRLLTSRSFYRRAPTPYRRLCPVSGSSLWAPPFQHRSHCRISWIRICKQPIVAKIASVYDFNKISGERGRSSLVALHVET